MDSRLKKFVWISTDTSDSRLISGGTKTNFYYNINGAIPLGAKNLTVELVSFTLINNSLFFSNASMLKILIDFGTQANHTSGILPGYTTAGVIPLQSPQYFYNGANTNLYNLNYLSESMTNKQPKYNILYPNNEIHVLLTNSGGTEVNNDYSVKACVFCLEFEYEI